MTPETQRNNYELSLLRDLHAKIRAYLRFKGVDSAKEEVAFRQLEAAVTKVNLFNEGLLEEEENDNSL